MSRNILTSVDMHKNEILNFAVQSLATAPSNPVESQLYYNSADKCLYQYNGSVWKRVGVEYTVSLGEPTNNSAEDAVVPLQIVSSDGKVSSVNLRGSGGCILTKVNDYVLDIKTFNTNTTYKFDIEAVADKCTITITPSSGTAQTINIPLANETSAGLISPEHYKQLASLPYALDLGKQISVDSEGNTSFDKVGLGFGTVNSALVADYIWFASNLITFTPDDDLNTINMNIPIDTSMSGSSTKPVQNKVIKAYVDNAIKNLPADQFLDLSKTTVVQSFSWSSTTYPGSTNPNLNGKPVLVLALTDGTNTTYSFVSLNDLVDVYTGTSPIKVSGGAISHENSGVTAGEYGGASATTLKSPKITVNAYGHITSITEQSRVVPVVKEYTLTAGNTSVRDTATQATLCGYVARDATTNEEVFLDCKNDPTSPSVEFSIAAAYSHNIKITAVYI